MQLAEVQTWFFLYSKPGILKIIFFSRNPFLMNEVKHYWFCRVLEILNYLQDVHAWNPSIQEKESGLQSWSQPGLSSKSEASLCLRPLWSSDKELISN